MSEIATLIGTHDLIMFGLYRSVSAPTIQPLEKLPIDCALPAQVGLFFATASLPGWRYWQQGQQRNRGFVHFLPAWNISLTSAFCARCRNR